MPTVLVHPGLPLGIDGSRLRERRPELDVATPGSRDAFPEAMPAAYVVVLSNRACDEAYPDRLGPDAAIQSVSAGCDRFTIDAFRERGSPSPTPTSTA